MAYRLWPANVGTEPRRFGHTRTVMSVLRTVAEGGAQFVTMEDAAREYDRRAPFNG